MALGAALLVAACGGGGEGDGLHCCTYESHHSACGGGDYTDWEASTYQFNMDDYIEGWTADMVCDQFSGSDTECSDTCCIYVEYRNTTVASGPCP